MSAIFTNETETSVTGPVTVVQPTGSNLHVEVDNFPATQDVNVVSSVLPTGAATEATLATRLADATFTARINTLGQKAMAASTPVVIASDQSAIPVTFSTAAGAPTVTRVAVSTTVATLAAANSARKRCIIHNEAGTLFVKIGTGATSTDYTYRLTGNTMLDIDFPVTTAITGIKATGTTDAQVTEIV